MMRAYRWGNSLKIGCNYSRLVIVMVFTRIILPNTMGTSGQKALNIIRSHATVVLNAVIIALQTRTLTARIITSAQEAIDDWLAEIDAA